MFACTSLKKKNGRNQGKKLLDSLYARLYPPPLQKKKDYREDNIMSIIRCLWKQTNQNKF